MYNCNYFVDHFSADISKSCSSPGWTPSVTFFNFLLTQILYVHMYQKFLLLACLHPDILDRAHRETTRNTPAHHLNDHGWPFRTNATINQRKNGLINSIILLLVDYNFFSFVDFRLVAQIADFIQNGGQANNTNGNLGTKMAQSCQKRLQT